ncbi:hypothetical protein TNCV_1138981 [Trichonephila clavipes]|nr:hypothetical protein TNCV_1138981 [Trichonephila clavipes]
MHKILGKALLSFEEMTTILTEKEAVLKLRPLSYVCEESDEPRPLTPMHFLNFGKNQSTYPVTFAKIKKKKKKMLNMSRLKRPPVGLEVRCQLRCCARHLTMAQN